MTELKVTAELNALDVRTEREIDAPRDLVFRAFKETGSVVFGKRRRYMQRHSEALLPLEGYPRPGVPEAVPLIRSTMMCGSFRSDQAA